ncbi:TetR/AcrR family transcriptional regulator C-terminal domain-containing protein [Pseudolysinimonas sp.]|uniref:TetR/AcrR family transcriptional regulator n=1 Tax=Pseudolysinimonas sp. TaxID=2680009 RepID=UPI00286C1276|nr:TetR/AcrR family transcriptional regulator C-terminal domain-containing protein [Pseudolysinimonas sp.]
MPRRPPTEPRTAAPDRLSRARIVADAVALADRDGLDAVSMRKLATGLGVDPMSIYNHVRDKGDLLDGMADAVVAAIEPVAPAETGWQAELSTLILSARREMLRHPWSASVLGSRSQPGPATLTHVDRVLGILRGGGLSLELAHHALHVLGSRILGFDESLFDDTAPADVDPALVAAQARAWAPTLPHVAELALAANHDGVLGACDDDGEFRFALDLILDGLERHRGRV